MKTQEDTAAEWQKQTNLGGFSNCAAVLSKDALQRGQLLHRTCNERHNVTFHHPQLLQLEVQVPEPVVHLEDYLEQPGEAVQDSLLDGRLQVPGKLQLGLRGHEQPAGPGRGVLCWLGGLLRHSSRLCCGGSSGFLLAIVFAVHVCDDNVFNVFARRRRHDFLEWPPPRSFVSLTTASERALGIQ
ncbi:hypothetical protein RR48_10515 [Papilio machaon]|uniref:Uncharacterized protein n=1 Tax=Papilio machaon TaxID=76193 RepID=A0A194R6L8_PAPMA|nr:hypothetical protein RR48_10515 [Papilio machaon]